MTDLSENMLAVAVKCRTAEDQQYRSHRLRCFRFALRRCQLRCHQLPHGSDVFPDLLAAAEMYRVLRPGGLLVVSVWEARAFNDWVVSR